jgi:predicted nucleic acid-binding protein
VRTVVVDASVVLGWFFPDEPSRSSAVVLLQEFLLDHVRLIAPRLLEYEVLNGLVVASRRGRLDPDPAANAWSGFQALGIELMETASDGDRILQIAGETGLSAYDSAYLAAALRENAFLATFDKNLAAAAKAKRIPLTVNP